MTNWRVLASNSDTLGAVDFADGPKTAQIESVEGGVFEDEEGKHDRKALVSFTRAHKKLAANVINCNLIERIVGSPEVEDWTGHAITLGADVVEVAGKYKGDPCVRVLGSPELDADTDVTITLPRRKPFTRRLTKTQLPGAR